MSLKVTEEAREPLVLYRVYEAELVSDGPHVLIRDDMNTTTKKVGYAGEVAIEKYLAALSISTYPVVEGLRQGDPIADHFGVHFSEDLVCIALADGCNWGKRATTAAATAVASFENYLLPLLPDIHTVRDGMHFLLRTFCEAHNSILAPHSERGDDIWTIGTTTLLGALLVPLYGESEEEPTYGVIIVNVGDCKAFVFNPDTKTAMDMTKQSKMYIRDKNDPGGRVGPYGKGDLPTCYPDLRNLSIYFVPVKPGDVIIAATDGVHDNFDPEQLGLTPRETELEGVNSEDWKDYKDNELENIKIAYREQFLGELLAKNGSDFEPEKVAATIIDHCSETTKKCRVFLETSNAVQPDSYRDYPGKLDHTSCVVVTVPQPKKKAKSKSRQSKKEAPLQPDLDDLPPKRRDSVKSERNPPSDVN